MRRYALLGSPFLGPQVWEPVADRLVAGGDEALVVTPRGGDPDAVLESMSAQLVGAGGELVLVPHSNAGLYVASLAARHRVSAVVFVDALVPGAGPTTPTAPPALAESLAALVDDDGVLPAWTSWWPESVAASLYPDARVRRHVESGAPRMPLSYLRADVPTPPSWAQLPCGYLAFGDAYAEERDGARARGWPVRSLPGAHLHQLVEPGAVAAAIEKLATPGAERSTGSARGDCDRTD